MPSQIVLELAIFLSVQFHNTLQNLQIKMSFSLTKSHTRLLYVEDLVSFQIFLLLQVLKYYNSQT